MSLKNLVTPSGIDPGTVRLVTQRLNHYATVLLPSGTESQAVSSFLQSVDSTLPTVAYRGGWFGGFNPPPRNSEDIGGVLNRMSKKNRRLDFLL